MSALSYRTFRGQRQADSRGALQRADVSAKWLRDADQPVHALLPPLQDQGPAALEGGRARWVCSLPLAGGFTLAILRLVRTQEPGCDGRFGSSRPPLGRSVVPRAPQLAFESGRSECRFDGLEIDSRTASNRSGQAFSECRPLHSLDAQNPKQCAFLLLRELGDVDLDMQRPALARALPLRIAFASRSRVVPRRCSFPTRHMQSFRNDRS